MLMNVVFQNSEPWLKSLDYSAIQQSIKIQMISGNGESTSIPVQFLTSSSLFLRTIYSDNCCLSLGNNMSISIPSASISTLNYVVEILTSGEVKMRRGLQPTLEIMKSIQSVMQLLGVNVRFGPKLIRSSSASSSSNRNEIFNLASDVNEEFASNSALSGEESSFNCLDSSDQNGNTIKSSMKRKDIGGLGCGEEINDINNDVDSGSEKYSIVSKKIISPSFNNCSEQFDNEASLKCEKCGYYFSRKGALEKHIRNDACFRFFNKKFLKPAVHKCSKCYLRFRSKDNLIKHQQKYHKELLATSLDETIQNNDYAENDNGTTYSEVTVQFDNSPSDIVTVNNSDGKLSQDSTDLRYYGCGSCDYINRYKSRVSSHCNVKGHDQSLIYMCYDKSPETKNC